MPGTGTGPSRSLAHERGHLRFAHDQLGAVLIRCRGARKRQPSCLAFVEPLDDVDEFVAKGIQIAMCVFLQELEMLAERSRAGYKIAHRFIAPFSGHARRRERGGVEVALVRRGMIGSGACP